MVEPTPPQQTIQLRDSFIIEDPCSYINICKAREQLKAQYPQINDAQIILEDKYIDNDDDSSYEFALSFCINVINPDLERLTKEYVAQHAQHKAWCAEESARHKRYAIALEAKREFKKTRSQERKDKRELQLHFKKCLSSGDNTFIIDGKTFALTEVK